MCGISGSFSPSGVHAASLRLATDAMQHRGPDAGGYYTDPSGKLFLGHRRLSIIDLSTGANQPMESADGRYVMVFNGEIYNFNELRDRLPGHPWKTHSDSEVILELFARYGTDSLAWLNGMFAIAFYDKQEETLYLCRDQVGIKPLFYYWDGNILVFASELKAVSGYFGQEGKKALSLNREAIPYFLHLGFIPEPQTIYREVQKFPAGHWAALRMKEAKLSFRAFWKLSDHFLRQPVADEQEALACYRQALEKAVRYQMISDVPLGTFLSGGIDSSLVTAIAATQSTQKVKTFSIGFHEAKYDESQHAAAVAAHLGTDHHLFKVSVDDVLELVPSLLDVYDEPFADSSAFPTMLVSKLARQHVTVTLSGDGGDETFQGYGMYTWASRLQKPLLRMSRKPLFAASRFMNNRYKRAGALFNYPALQRLHTHIFSQEQYFFSEQELKRIVPGLSFDFTEVNDLHLPEGLGTPSERQAYWDFEHYLKDDLLVKVDRASMKYSLESRVPLLDIGLVELAMNIDYRLKVNEGYGTKYLMKKVLYDLVPRQIFERPKRGFAMPLKEWLRGPLAYLLHDHLSEQKVKEYGIADPAAVSSLLKRFNNGEDYLFNRIWVLVILHWWLSEKFDHA